MMNNALTVGLIGIVLGLSTPAYAQEIGPPKGVHRVVFLGDSITYSGEYIEFVEAALRIKNPTLDCEFLDLGLPSETVSGLSEPGHAGGQFPRPELRERLDRILAQLEPDLIVACYGMNDGIYHPFSDDRFLKYQEGMSQLRSRAEAAGAKVFHLTPPVFDSVPIKSRTLPAGLTEYPQPYVGYDDVLGHYSDWLLSQRAQGWEVIDIYGPMKQFLEAARLRDPKFRLAGDGVHIDSTGHAIMARQLLLHWGCSAKDFPEASSVTALFDVSPQRKKILDLVRQKQHILKDAWLTETKHKRPGMRAGLTLDKANSRIAELERQIRDSLKPDNPDH